MSCDIYYSDDKLLLMKKLFVFMDKVFIFGFIWIVLLLSIWIIIAMLWKFMKNYFHSNYSFFDVSFIIAYFIQQFILILLLELKPNNAVLWVGLFALIVVTTASLQKLTMDSRDRELRDLQTLERHLKEQTESFNYELIEENDKLKAHLKKLSDYIERIEQKLKKK